MPDTFVVALSRILRPLARAMIARGFRFPAAAEVLKCAYVDAAERDFRLDGKRLTDSRVSLLTGLQRRDVHALRGGDGGSTENSAGQLPRVLARWLGDPRYGRGADGPAELPRAGAAPSFESLAAEVSQDLHPRTVLDELVRLGAVRLDKTSDRVRLIRNALIPSADEDALLGYFGANLGDHLEAATSNLAVAPKAGPFFERAVHYNQLSEASAKKLESLARTLQTEALGALNEEALRLQTQDAKLGGGARRFRCGAYVFLDDTDEEDG